MMASDILGYTSWASHLIIWMHREADVAQKNYAKT
jgi:hypothetical protein